MLTFTDSLNHKYELKTCIIYFKVIFLYSSEGHILVSSFDFPT